METKILDQAEIDAFFGDDDTLDESVGEEITPEEADVLGEIGNISMGSAATTLSELLNHKVLITSPEVKVFSQEELFTSFNKPYLAIEVKFTDGLDGLNLLVMQVKDASIIADMMMGGDGLNVKEELSEIEMSAASEAMNQMIGSAATSMSQMFENSINITPPDSRIIDAESKDYRPFDSENIVIVSFRMTIGELVDSKIMQIMSPAAAKEKANLLMGGNEKKQEATEEFVAPMEKEPAVAARVEEKIEVSSQPTSTAQVSRRDVVDIDKKYDLILDIPLKVSVLLGKTKKNIGEILRLGPGSIVELDKIVDEDVDILVNGTLVAKGEVVVIDENFGVRIKMIISPADRINHIKS